MKILVCGIGAIGSNLVARLVPDLKGEHQITVLDNDTVEERNTTAGTQLYFPEQIGIAKVDALQFNIYKQFQREIKTINKNVFDVPTSKFDDFDILVDAFDNTRARNRVTSYGTTGKARVLHAGFSNQYTFAVEWNDNYKVPIDISGMDICELPGAAAFVNSVASLTALVVQQYIEDGKELEILGGKFEHRIVR